MTPTEIILALELENERLRERLEQIAQYGCLGEEIEICRDVESCIDEYCHPCQANEALPPNVQPTPTTGLLDVVRAAVEVERMGKCTDYDIGYQKDYGAACMGLSEAIQALPLEVREMVEG